MSELWIAHHSVDAWQAPSLWTAYMEEAQQLVGSPLTHLDVNDPLRRKVTSLADVGNFICAFDPREESRWLFGRCGKTGIGLSITHYRQPGQNRRCNYLRWHTPLSFVEQGENRKRLKALFDLGNRTFKAFYAYSDDVEQLKKKNKPSGSIDIETELPGVFWFTYFSPAYVAFFGKDKFSGVPSVEHGSDGSITIVLGDSPKSVANELREQVAAMLGKQSFVNPSDILVKQRGRFALTFPQLLVER